MPENISEVDIRDISRGGLQLTTGGKITENVISAGALLRIAEAAEAIVETNRTLVQNTLGAQDRIAYLEDALLKMTTKRNNAASRVKQLEAELLEAREIIKSLQTEIE